MKKDLVSITDLSKVELESLMELALSFENKFEQTLQGKVVAVLFFEPSTRTRLSFESAINRLGGRVIGFSDTSNTSISKGESFSDTIKIISSYCDLIVIRHPLEGAARLASEVASVPVINAGDGTNQHPTQTLLDLYSIWKTQGGLNNLNISMVGDLKYGRTVHSLLQAMSHFNPKFSFVSPVETSLPQEYTSYLDKKNINYKITSLLNDVVNETDILYMTRVQKERFADQLEYEKVKSLYELTPNILVNTKKNLKILHPLPRLSEISKEVDKLESAYYFNQAKNGVFARAAIMSYLLK